MMRERRVAGGQGDVEVGGEAVAVALDDAGGEALLDRPVGAVLLLDRRGADALEHREELLQRVVVVGAPVVDDVEADLLLLLGDPSERRDAGGVDDGRVEAGLGRLVQVHRVEDVAGGRVEAEGDVGEPERGVDAGQVLLDELDALERGHAVAAALLHAGAEREGERVEEQVAGLEAVAVDGDVVDRPWPPSASTRACGPGPPRRCRCTRRRRRTRGPATGSGRAGCRARRRPRG